MCVLTTMLYYIICLHRMSYTCSTLLSSSTWFSLCRPTQAFCSSTVAVRARCLLIISFCCSSSFLIFLCSLAQPHLPKLWCQFSCSAYFSSINKLIEIVRLLSCKSRNEKKQVVVKKDPRQKIAKMLSINWIGSYFHHTTLVAVL